MKTCTGVLVALLLHGACHAAPVTVTGSGILSTAGGVYRAGDPFRFATAYDDASSRNFTEPGVYASYSSVKTAPIVFIVRGDTIVASVLYDMIVSANHFFIGTPADYSPTSGIDFTLARSNPLDFSLPSAAELQGASGVFSFVYRAAPGLAGSGSGAFVLPVQAVAEPEAVLMLALGAMILIVGRRRGAVRSTPPQPAL